MSSTTQQNDTNCVSIRSRIRKSQRVIDPQFDNVQEILVSFVTNSTSNTNSNNNNKGTAKGKGGEKGGEPAILLTPIPKFTRSRSSNVSIKTTRQRSLNNPALFNNSSIEVKRKQSIISDIGSDNGDADNGLNNSNVEDSLESEGEFIGLEKLELGVDDNSDLLNKSHHSHSHAQPMQLNISRLKPPQSNERGLLPPTGNNNSRYSSPLNVIRTSSGVSINGNGGEGSVISGGTNSDHLSSSVRSRSSRSRSRSRSRRRPTRMRSYGASSAFANASNNNNGGMNGSVNGEESDIGDCSDGEKQSEPITIPLKDILSVDEEVPSRKGGSSANGSGGGSDFYSSAASDVGIAKELKRGDSRLSTPKASNSTPSFSQLRKDWDNQGNSSTTTKQTQKIPHRIFLHTLSHGYVEFSLENENSHDIFMAYLKAHLSSDRIPQRGNGSNSDCGSNAGSNSSAGVKHRTASASGGLLRTMVLTPTKEVPSIESRSTSIESSTAKSQKSQLNLPDKDTYDGQAPPPSSPKRRNSKHRPTLVSRDSSSVSVCSNKIDKLHSKIINQRIKNESTTFSRVKESFEGWMSSIVDCACCQDTTVAPDPSTVGGNSIQSNKGIILEGTPDSSRMKNGKQRSPTSERLRSKGIGGLSFEVESCPPGSPKLSFEQSMG